MIARCRSTHKIIHSSKEDAKRVITAMWAKNPSLKIGDLEAYECVYCHGIHIGHAKNRMKGKQYVK